jgi:hypothetical protein
MPDERRINLAGGCGCGRGVETECGPDARAEKAPTAEGIHIFSRLKLGRPA